MLVYWRVQVLLTKLPSTNIQHWENLPFGIFWVVFREGNSLELKAASKFGKWMEMVVISNQPFPIRKGLVHSWSKFTQLLLGSCFKHFFSLTWGRWSNLTIWYFSNGLVSSTTNYRQPFWTKNGLFGIPGIHHLPSLFRALIFSRPGLSGHCCWRGLQVR